MAGGKLPEIPKPKLERRDYWRVGPVYVWKWIVLLAAAGGAAMVLAALGLPSFPRPDPGPPSYRYDDPKLAGVSGTVRVLDGSGTVRYEGEVAEGAYTGLGTVYDAGGSPVYSGPLLDGRYEGPDAKVYRDGFLVYEGEMAQNLYEGQGRRTDPATGTVSEGAFSHGRLEGEGREFSRSGTLLRSGTFSRDLLNGPGAEYGPDGALLREGTFADGLLNGEGVEYAAGGAAEYEGAFRRGVRQGRGRLYDTDLGALAYEGEFQDGQPRGAGRIYHPSGQLLYEGAVYGGEPRADAFLGLSLEEVEAAFTEHWLLYTDGTASAFVYPYFHLMFAAEAPVKLSGAAADGDGPAPEAEPAPEEDAAPEGRALSPETARRDVVIAEVLSYGGPLAGAAQPEQPPERRQSGWRERFSDFAAFPGGGGAARTGPFVYEFAPWEDAREVECRLAERGGVETRTVRREDKDDSLWYQSAVRKEGA